MGTPNRIDIIAGKLANNETTRTEVDGPTGEKSFSELKTELMSIKEMIYLLNHSGSIIDNLVVKPSIVNLYAKLIRNGVQDLYVKDVF